MRKKNIIAIDGTAGSGKSSLAKALAKKMKYRYIDTGAMYRFLTYHCIKRNIKSEKDIVSLSKNLKITLRSLQTDKIRLPEVSDLVSKIAAIGGVRKWMVKHQRELAKNGGVVVEGRDIGTVVFPDADIKFFLTAGVEERSKRRYKELLQKGIIIAKKNVCKNLIKRDAKDSCRKVSPLRPAKDAIVIDTTKLTIPQKNNLAWRYVKENVL
jgi:cytidylate kinase